MAAPAPRSGIMRAALRITAIYALVAIIWITASDYMLDLLFDEPLHLMIQMLKDTGFVIITSGLLYALIRRDLSAMQRSQARYRAVFDATHDGLFITTADGRCLDANVAACTLTSYTHNQLSQVTLADLLPVDGTGDGVLNDTLLRTRTGAIVPVDVVQTPLPWDGQAAFLTVVRDTTERKQAEDALRASEARLRTLLEQAPVGIAMSRAGITIYANPAYVRMFGFDALEELTGRSLLDQIAPQCHADILERNQRRERGEPVPDSYETTGQRRDGTTFPMQVDVALLALEGSPATLVFVSDITERKQAERAIRESEANYRRVFERSPLPMWIVDSASEAFLAVNHAAIAHYGYSREAFLGMTMRDLREAAHDPHARTADQIPPSHPWQADIRQHRTRVGAIIDVEMMTHKLNFDGRAALLVIINDVTARTGAVAALQAAVAREQAILQGTTDSITLRDREGRFLLVNPAAADIIGQPASALIGVRVQDLELSGAAQATRERDIHIMQTGAQLETELQVGTGDQAQVFSVVGSPYRDADGAIQGVISVARNITDRKRMELALRQSEARFRYLSALASEGIAIISEGRIIEANQRLAELFGCHLAALIGSAEQDVLPTIPRPSGVTQQPYESIGVRDDGTTFPIGIVRRVDRYQDRTVTIVLCRDLTEQQRTEAAVRQSEATLRALINAMPDLMFRLSRTGIFLDYHAPESYSPLVPPREFLGKHMSAIMPPEVSAASMAAIEQTITTGAPQIFEYQLQREDRVEEYEARFVLSDTEEVLAIVRDITERKRLERQISAARDVYLTLVEEAPMLVWRVNQHGLCDFVNKQWVMFTGKPATNAYGSELLASIHSDDRITVHETARHAFLTRQQFDLEFRLAHHADGYRWQVVRGTPFWSDQGEFAGYIGTCIDIHERKQQEQIKDDFLALASHELKTPLAALLGYLHLLERWSTQQQLSERFVQAIHAMSNESAHLNHLINDLLDVSRIQTGKLRLHKYPTDLIPLVQQTVTSVQLAVPDHAFVLDVGGHSELTLPIDAQRIEQALTNLCTNAAKYSIPQAPVLIRLRTDQHHVMLTVQDCGLGIPAADLPYIFDRFYQVQRPTRESRPGLGLGLFITHEIVRQHGGTIHVQSIEHSGSTFTVLLPLRHATNDTDQEPNSHAEPTLER